MKYFKLLVNVLKTNEFYNVSTFVGSILLTTFIIAGGLFLSTEITGYNRDSLDHPVNRKTCECGCWDGFFRGKYSRLSQGTLYKAFYFNYDKQIIVILAIFLLYSHLIKEILIKIIKLLIFNFNNIRFGCLINLLISSYSNYYAGWVLRNYLNDRHYEMIYSQTFFALTEFIPSYIYYQYLEKENSNKIHKHITLSIVYPVLFIACLHLFLALPERILWGFLTSSYNDAATNKTRDIFLMLNDIAGIIFSIYYLLQIRKNGVESHFNKNLSLGNGHSFYLKFWSSICFILYIFYRLFCSIN